MWTPWYIAAFIIGLINLVVCVFGYLFPSRKLTLFLRLTFDILAAVNGLCIYFAFKDASLLSVVAIDSIGMIRDIVFIYKKKINKTINVLLICAFEIVIGTSLTYTWAGPISLLPCFGGMIITFALYLDKQSFTKSLVLVGQTMFITYYSLLIHGSDCLTILNVVASTTLFISAFIGLLHLVKQKQ